MSKSKRPPKSADTISKQLRWYLTNSEMLRSHIAREADVDHATVFKFISEQRSMSLDAVDAVAKVLKLRLVRDKK